MSGGGTERAMLMLANQWAKEQRDVVMVLWTASGPLLQQLDSRVEVVSLRTKNPLVATLRFSRFLARADSETVVLSALNPSNMVALLAAKLSSRSIPVLACVQNHLGAKYRSNPSFLNPVRKFVIGWVLRRCTGVVAVSKTIRSYLSAELGIPQSLCAVIYNPVELDPSISDETANPPHQWFCDDKGPVLIAAGRLTKQKRFDLLIDAMTHLPDSVRLIIIGEGELRPEIEDQISRLNLKQRVDLPGFQNNPTNWFSFADCYVLSSDWEGFPFVLLEAMAAGLQVVATDCPSGPAELLADGAYGHLMPCGDTQAIAKAILSGLEKPYNRDTLIERVKEFRVEEISSQYVRALEQCLDSR